MIVCLFVVFALTAAVTFFALPWIEFETLWKSIHILSQTSFTNQY